MGTGVLPNRRSDDRIHDFCRENNVFLLDLLPAFSEQKAESLWVHFTDFHPNEIAHRIAAEGIHAFLKRHELLKTLGVEEQ